MLKTKSRNFALTLGKTEDRTTPKKRTKDKGYDSATNFSHDGIGLIVLPAKDDAKRRKSAINGYVRRKSLKDDSVRSGRSSSKGRIDRDAMSELKSSYVGSNRNSREFRVRKKKAPFRKQSS